MLPTVANAWRATADPQTGTYNDGTKWAIVPAAANASRWDDEKKEWVTTATLFVSITGTGHLAQRLAELGKGDPFYASGEISTERREHNGTTYTNVRLRAREMRLLERQGGQQQGAQQGGAAEYGYGSGYRGPQAQQQEDPWNSAPAGGGFGGGDESPPF